MFRIDPETAHHVTVTWGQALCALPMARRMIHQKYPVEMPRLEQVLMGIRFPNPIGIAAGFDKNASLTHLLQLLGFGYAEYGSITALPSAGNPRPRLFRLPADRALINRMGLNNDGAEAICRRILKDPGFPGGINIAKTHDPDIVGDQAIRDYITSYSWARTVADYITLNISCPNTVEGKTFEETQALADLLDGIMETRLPDDPPLLVKFSPDLTLNRLDELTDICESHNLHGYVLSNTSAHRERLITGNAIVAKAGRGGLSGAPVFPLTLQRIAHLRARLPYNRVLIGCGGIDSPDKALQLLRAGANLLQIYTGLIYEGPNLISKINKSIGQQLRTAGKTSLKRWLREQQAYQFSSS